MYVYAYIYIYMYRLPEARALLLDTPQVLSKSVKRTKNKQSKLNESMSSLYVCMYVFLCLYVYVCMYVFVCVCIYVCV